MAMAFAFSITEEMDNASGSEVEDAITACTEENELLNSNAIKMTDAPFGRSDSEDDIIEDYDDVVNFKGPCCKGRTGLERGLLVLIVLLTVVIIGLAVGLTRPKVIPEKEYCKTTQCVQAASSILTSMDREVDPCTDFFRYACGGWVRQNPIPKGYHKWDRTQELSGQNLYVLKRLLESDQTLKGTAEKKARTFYRSCMSKANATSRQTTLQRFKQLVEDVGGWSISNVTSASKWFIVTALQRVHLRGAWPLFKVVVDLDEKNPTRRFILKLELGETVMPTDMYPPLRPPSRPTSAPSPTPAQGDNTNDFNTNGSASDPTTAYPPWTTPTTTTTTTTTENPVVVAEKVKQYFVTETRPILQALGFRPDLAESRARQMAELEHKIATATEGKAHVHDRSSLYNVMTLEDLEIKYPIYQFSWAQYFKTLGFDVNLDDQVVLFHPGYLANLTALLDSAKKSPSEMSVLRDYLAITLVRSFKQYFDPGLFDMVELEADSMQEPWKRCTFYTNKAFGFATGAIFVRGTGHEGNMDEIQRLISYVRGAFKEFILRKFWIDDKTRLKAEEKVDSIINKISYPSYIMNTTFLDKVYEQFAVDADKWLENLLNWRDFELQRQVGELKTVPDRKKSWIRPPVTVNAYYSPTRNDVIFPIAMFHLPYYIPNGPTAVNFGAMGSVIGHEITHAFDLQGRQYDAEGRLTDWWDPHSTENFGITTQCMVDQYNNIKVKGQRVDGEYTLDENIADNGGLRAAHYAYMKWLEEKGGEEAEAPLPSLNLTHHQVFFLSYAQMYCSKWSDMGLELHLLTDPHSPGAARVNGVLANSKTFSWAFQCPVYSKMNAQTKCEVW